MKEIARIEIHTDGKDVDMAFSVNGETRSEKIAIGSYLARALLDLCAEIDPDTPGTAALRFLFVAAHIPRSDERVLS